jgi:hypothetical protein
MAFPEFRHIHCSSRFDRPAALLESDMDNWQDASDLVTLTEISNDRLAATMRAKGWDYFNAKKSQGQDECGVTWRTSMWGKTKSVTIKLNNDAYYRLDGRVADPVVSCSVVLKHRTSGHRLLVSVTHMPAHVEGFGGWRTTEYKWQARKAAYLSSLKNWNVHVDDLIRKQKPDATLVIADWNLNLKQDWIRALLRQTFGDLKQAWQRFPTSGGSLQGGPVAPLGAPGKGYADRIIDGTLYRGAVVSTEPNLMATVRSSDHRPYHEAFRFKAAAGAPGVVEGDESDQASGNTSPGEAWWGFGDYMDDEIYTIGAVTGEAGGEVL